jgi:hypothetical protein
MQGRPVASSASSRLRNPPHPTPSFWHALQPLTHVMMLARLAAMGGRAVASSASCRLLMYPSGSCAFSEARAPSSAPTQRGTSQRMERVGGFGGALEYSTAACQSVAALRQIWGQRGSGSKPLPQAQRLAGGVCSQTGGMPRDRCSCPAPLVHAPESETEGSTGWHMLLPCADAEARSCSCPPASAAPAAFAASCCCCGDVRL